MSVFVPGNCVSIYKILHGFSESIQVGLFGLVPMPICYVLCHVHVHVRVHDPSD